MRVGLQDTLEIVRFIRGNSPRHPTLSDVESLHSQCVEQIAKSRWNQRRRKLGVKSQTVNVFIIDRFKTGPFHRMILDYLRGESGELKRKLLAVSKADDERREVNEVLGQIAAADETPMAFDHDRPPGRIQIVEYRILRETKYAMNVKKLHSFQCQLCDENSGRPIRLPGGRLYAEAHHIQPLGKPHNGSDRPSNILCVCPNCHVMLDFGVIKIDIGNLRKADQHTVDAKYITYHNDKIFGQSPRRKRVPAI